jgi:hypothetical protein
MLLVISIILEASIAVIAVLAARQGRPYIYGLAFTFIVYVVYDLARFMRWSVEGPVCTENLIRIDWLTESPNVSVRCWRCYPLSWPF